MPRMDGRPRPRAFFVLVLNCPAMFPVADSPSSERGPGRPGAPRITDRPPPRPAVRKSVTVRRSGRVPCSASWFRRFLRLFHDPGHNVRAAFQRRIGQVRVSLRHLRPYSRSGTRLRPVGSCRRLDATSRYSRCLLAGTHSILKLL